MIIVVSAQPDGLESSGFGKAVFLLEDNTRVLGGWIDSGFPMAAEALKVALPNAKIHYDPRCREESKALWESVKVFQDHEI
jgi:hypothetical protein